MNIAPNEQVFCILFGACRVHIVCDSDLLNTLLGEHLRYCRIDPLDTSPLLDFRITTRGSVYDLWREGQPPLYGLSADNLLVYLMDGLVTRLIEPCADRLLFHAAGVAWQGQGAVLCGASGSGKSTLAVLLIPRGFGYLSDEVTALPIDPVDGTLTMFGLARSLVLKPGSASARRAVVGKGYDFADGSAWVSAEAIRAGSFRSSAVGRLLIFPRYQATAGFTVQPLSQAQSAFMLMQHLVNARNLPTHGLMAVTHWATLLPAYSIVYSDAALVSEWLSDHLATGSDLGTINDAQTPRG